MRLFLYAMAKKAASMALVSTNDGEKSGSDGT
jgi:hypothetical protein